MAERTKGKCKFCGKEYTFGYMNRHLGTCKARQEQILKEDGKKVHGYFNLAIYQKHNRDYWLFIEIRETATLRDLDEFLRDIWLECCGHLSSFNIDGILYDSEPDTDPFWGDPTESMNHRLKGILEKGLTFEYEYDFGSTTELLITVVNYRRSLALKDKITILSRNNPITHMCDVCGEKPAVCVCSICMWDDDAFLCEDCAKTHECGEEALLPVCNSPRVGVCAYEGSIIYPDQFVPDQQPASSKKTTRKTT